MSGYSFFARHYDKLTENVDYHRRAEYFDELLRRHGAQPGGLVLDLACGTGSLSLELCALGYEVIGVDASADMLSVAMNKGMEAARPVLFLNQTMTGLDLYGTVDDTICALDSLNHLPGEQALDAAFRKVALFTAPGGLFVFDVNTAYKHREILADNAFVYELDDVYCVWRNRYNPGDNRVDICLDFFEEDEDGRYIRTVESFSERYFSGETLERLLVQNGFTVLAVYGDDSDRPPSPETQRCIYVARRL